MLTKGRLTPEGTAGDFVASILDKNRGIRIDHTAMPAFWVEALFEPEDINKLATRDVYVLLREVEHESCDLVGIYRRLGEARRAAWQLPRPTYAPNDTWSQDPAEIGDLFKLSCSDVNIIIRKVAVK